MCPMVDPDITGAVGESPYPWVKKDEIVDVAVAVVQAWGWLGSAADSKFQVCLLLQLLEDRIDSHGDDIPELVAISFDAESQDNPRRRWLDYFADPNAQPVGPLALQRIEADNQQGWVWALRKCPKPAELVDDSRILRVLYRQAWKQEAIANARKRQAAIVAAQQAQLAAASVNGQSDDLPF